jgi:hypothetical protein
LVVTLSISLRPATYVRSDALRLIADFSPNAFIPERVQARIVSRNAAIFLVVTLCKFQDVRILSA